MRVLIAVVIVTIGLASCGRLEHQHGIHVVLPNSKLLGCTSSSCSQLWQDSRADANAIYPREVIIDIFGNGTCPRGIVALYDKSVSTDNIKAALDQRYGEWAQPGNAALPVKLWRVEPQKFAIQLAVTDERTEGTIPEEALARALAQALGHGERSDVAEKGMKQVVYLAFAGAKCGWLIR